MILRRIDIIAITSKIWIIAPTPYAKKPIAQIITITTAIV